MSLQSRFEEIWKPTYKVYDIRYIALWGEYYRINVYSTQKKELIEDIFIKESFFVKFNKARNKIEKISPEIQK